MRDVRIGYERRNSPRVQGNCGDLRLRRGIHHQIHQGQSPVGDLLQVPPLLHRQAEAGGLRRYGGEIRAPLRQEGRENPPRSKPSRPVFPLSPHWRNSPRGFPAGHGPCCKRSRSWKRPTRRSPPVWAIRSCWPTGMNTGKPRGSGRSWSRWWSATASISVSSASWPTPSRCSRKWAVTWARPRCANWPARSWTPCAHSWSSSPPT